MINVAIQDAVWVLRAPHSPETGRTMGNTVAFTDDRPRAPITAALVKLADHVVAWHNVTQNGATVPCSLECVVAVLASDENAKHQVETALRHAARSAIN